MGAAVSTMHYSESDASKMLCPNTTIGEGTIPRTTLCSEIMRGTGGSVVEFSFDGSHPDGRSTGCSTGTPYSFLPDIVKKIDPAGDSSFCLFVVPSTDNESKGNFLYYISEG